MLTVGEVMQIPLLKRAKVVSGHQGLKNRVKWFHIIDFPQFVPWLDGGELLFTTAYAIAENPGITEGLVEAMVAHQVAGLAMAKDLYLSEFPENMRRAADKLGFPLIELPMELHVQHVTKEMGKLLFRQYWMEQSDSWMEQDKIMSLANLEGDLGKVIDALHMMGKMNVAVLDEHGQIVSATDWSKNRAFSTVVSSIREVMSANASDLNKPFGGVVEQDEADAVNWKVHYYVQAIYGNTEHSQDILGVMVIGKDEPIITEDVLLIRQASVAAAPGLKREGLTKGEFRREKSLSALLPGFEYIPGKFDWTGYFDFTRSHVIMFMALDDFEKYVASQRMTEDDIRELLRTYYDCIDTSFNRANKSNLILCKGELVALAVHIYREYEIDDLIEIVQKANESLQQQYSGACFSAGISGADIGERKLLSRIMEAIEALETVQCTFGQKSVGYYPKLGGSRLLYSMSKQGAASNVINEILGTLNSYDAEYKSELLRTLEEYIKCKGNISKVGREMFVHRGTVSYRLQKIAELTGMDPQDPLNLVAFSILVQIRNAVKKEDAGGSIRKKVFGGRNAI